MAGSRAFCAMKHFGMNVVSDALMTMTMTGVADGLVIAMVRPSTSRGATRSSRPTAVKSSAPSCTSKARPVPVAAFACNPVPLTLVPIEMPAMPIHMKKKAKANRSLTSDKKHLCETTSYSVLVFLLMILLVNMMSASAL